MDYRSDDIYAPINDQNGQVFGRVVDSWRIDLEKIVEVRLYLFGALLDYSLGYLVGYVPGIIEPNCKQFIIACYQVHKTLGNRSSHFLLFGIVLAIG